MHTSPKHQNVTHINWASLINFYMILAVKRRIYQADRVYVFADPGLPISIVQLPLCWFSSPLQLLLSFMRLPATTVCMDANVIFAALPVTRIWTWEDARQTKKKANINTKNYTNEEKLILLIIIIITIIIMMMIIIIRRGFSRKHCCCVHSILLWSTNRLTPCATPVHLTVSGTALISGMTIKKRSAEICVPPLSIDRSRALLAWSHLRQRRNRW